MSVQQPTCEKCGRSFEPRRRTQRFCSHACIKAAWKVRNPDAVRAEGRERMRKVRDTPEGKASNRAITARYYVERREWLEQYKRERGCVDCGTREGELHFDHRPGEDRLFWLGRDTASSWSRLLAEMAKCDVRCASCHARRHVRERSRHPNGRFKKDGPEFGDVTVSDA